jgi:hypothetical protein
LFSRWGQRNRRILGQCFRCKCYRRRYIKIIIIVIIIVVNRHIIISLYTRSKSRYHCICWS